MSLNDENDALTDAVLSRIDADARTTKAEAAIKKGKAVLLGSAGLALVLAGTGGGVGLAFLGYSRVVAKQVIAQHEARDAFLAALSRATIKADGTVKLADGGEVALKKGGTVLVDPDSVVRVSGTVAADMPRRSPELAAPVASKADVIIDLSEFHNVRFGAGLVQSGWDFNTRDQQRPSSQRCEYIGPTVDGVEPAIMIGRDGRMTLPISAPAGVDLRAAYAKCQWWTESATTQRSAQK